MCHTAPTIYGMELDLAMEIDDLGLVLDIREKAAA